MALVTVSNDDAVQRAVARSVQDNRLCWVTPVRLANRNGIDRENTTRLIRTRAKIALAGCGAGAFACRVSFYLVPEAVDERLRH